MISLANEDLREIASRLHSLVQAGLEAKGSLPSRWAENESLYDNEPPVEEDEESKIVRVPTRFLQPRVDMLTALVCGVVAKQDPYMIARDMQSGERSDRLERALQFFWQREPAAFGRKARNASTIAANTNKAIWKVSYRPVKGPKGGIVLEVIHPDYYVCAPATLDGPCEAKLVGNCFFRRRRWVKDGQANGELLDYDGREIGVARLEEADRTGGIHRSLSQPSTTGVERDDELVKIWDLVVRLELSEGKGERFYRVLLAEDGPCVLSIEEYPYSRPFYFESFYISDEKSYWSGRSVSYNLQACDKTYGMLFSALYNGVMNEALPLVVGAGLPEKFTEYGFGEVIPDADEMVSPPWAAPSRFGGGQALIYAMQETSRVGDQVARVSQNTMGSLASRDATATEQNIVASGVGAGQEEYIANFSVPFPSMAEATMELLGAHWKDWYPVFGLRPMMEPAIDLATGQPHADGTMAQVVDRTTGRPRYSGMVDLRREDLEATVVWEPTGKTPGHTPAAKLQAAQMLLGAASQMPQAGGDVYELFKVMVNASGLNADGVQMSREKMQPQQPAGIDPQVIAMMAKAMRPGQGPAGGSSVE